MTDHEMNTMSRLAMLKIAGNIARFDKVTAESKNLSARCRVNILEMRHNKRSNPIVCSLLEWAESELGK